MWVSLSLFEWYNAEDGEFSLSVCELNIPPIVNKSLFRLTRYVSLDQDMKKRFYLNLDVLFVSVLKDKLMKTNAYR